MKKVAGIAAALIFVVIAFFQLWLTGFIYSGTIGEWFYLYLTLKILLWLYGSLALFYPIYQWRKNRQHSFVNQKLLVLTVVFTLWTVELVYCFIPASETTETCLSNYTWMLYYRKPINEQGFRDASWQSKNRHARHKIVFIGDSYTEGFGLKDTAERFSNIVANYLGEDWEAYNMGVKSYRTTDELQVLHHLSFKPDVIVWQYLFNDAEDVCHEALNYFPNVNMYSDINPLVRWLIMRSYFVNWYYFRWKTFPVFTTYDNFFAECAGNKMAMQKHFMQLDRIKNYCDANKILLIPVVIPHLQSHLAFSEIANLAFDHFYRIGSHPLSLREAAEQTPAELRSVSSIDAHPGEYFSHIIADSIFARVKESGLLNEKD